VQIGTTEAGAIGLGTAPLAFRDVARDRAVALIREAVDRGVRLIDTALAYTRPDEPSWAEETVAAALSAFRPQQRPLVATKGGHWREGDRFPVDGRPETLRRHCRISLETLGVDRLDLYQLHHVDPSVPLGESVGALAELRDAGLIDMIGLSNVSPEQIDEAAAIAPIATVQNRLSLAEPGDLPTARHCAGRGITYLAYQPLAGGRGKIDDLPGLGQLAGAHGVSPARIALAWLMAQSGNILPLVGTTRTETLNDSLASAEVRLSDTELSSLRGA